MPDFYFDDFEIGKRYVSPKFTLSEEQSIEFARQYDPQYFHLDAEAARDSVFKGLAAPGFQTAALAWKLVLETGLFDQCAIAGLGVDALRWRRPVRPGDTLHVDFTLIDRTPSRSSSEQGIATFEYEMKNQRGEVVMTLKLTQMLRRRDASEGAPR